MKIGIITSSYGMRVNPITNKYVMHDGIDIGADTGTDAYAIANGKIIETGEEPSYGLYIKYKVDNDYEIFYAHLDEILVKENDIVNKDTVIGKIGNTGNSTGSHLHYSIYKDGKSIDPINYLTLSYTDGIVEEYVERGELFTYGY